MTRFYVEVARVALRRQLAYPWANIAGLVTNAFFGAIVSYVVIALYRARPSAAGYDISDTLRYVWLVQALIMVVLPFGWFDLMLTIASGDVVSDLSKPCDFYWYWFSRECGRDLYYLVLRALPTYLLGMVFFGVGAARSWPVWPAFAASLALAGALGIAYRFIYNLAAFWIIEGRVMGLMAHTVALFFGGSIVPIPFFPPWLRAVTEWTPFSGLMNVPAEVFVGKLSGANLALGLARQGLWLVVLTLLARVLVRAANRRIVVQGG